MGLGRTVFQFSGISNQIDGDPLGAWSVRRHLWWTASRLVEHRCWDVCKACVLAEGGTELCHGPSLAAISLASVGERVWLELPNDYRLEFILLCFAVITYDLPLSLCMFGLHVSPLREKWETFFL